MTDGDIDYDVLRLTYLYKLIEDIDKAKSRKYSFYTELTMSQRQARDWKPQWKGKAGRLKQT